MKDMLGRNVNIGDDVLYVFRNAQSKQLAVQGKIVGFNKMGAKILTKDGLAISVKNIILQHKNIKNIGLFDFLKQVFH